MKQTFTMSHSLARRRAMEAVANAPEGHVVTVSEPTRSSDANSKLHAELSEIAAGIEWCGRKRPIETWKRLMTAAWLRARGESVEVLQAIDGHGVDVVFRRTSTLSRAEMSELIEYVLAWKSENMEVA